MIYERIKQLCDIKGISVSELERRIEVSRGSICKIDKHTPNYKTIDKIALELNTDAGYLLNGEQNALTDDMVSEYIDLISKWIRLSPEKQKAVMDIIDALNGEGE